jgi:polyisoprenyl-phosphate glycosyltransferase
MKNARETTMVAPKKPTISIVIPAYNEAEGIENTVRVVHDELSRAGTVHELIVVDDGSPDGTYETLQRLSQKFPTLKAIRLSRNFGKEAALLAGLKGSSGDAVITMDADLQHPPAVVPQLIQKWQEGYKIVHAVKATRGSESRLAKWRASAFNFIFEKLGGISLKHSSDFILMDREARNVMIRCLPERMRFYRGLAHWMGFKQTIVSFDVADRWDKGKSRWSMMSLVNLATTALVSFTSTPLRIVTVLGFVTLAIGLIIGLEALVSWLLGRSVSGFATTIGTLLIIGSFIMISLGIIGEYIAKIYEEIKGRPTCIVECSFGLKGVDETEIIEECNPSSVFGGGGKRAA